jgi:hypothetical protein
MPANPLPSLPDIPGFNSTRFIPFTVDDLTPVASDVMEHFRVQGYEVTGERTPKRGWHVSITKGTIFHAVLGMKTALNIEMETTPTATMAKAGIGIFGRQVIPVLIARFVFWPVWLTQIWGLVQQSRLDDEALDAVERSLRAHATRVTEVHSSATHSNGASGSDGSAQRPGQQASFCTSCGARLETRSRFCPECGTKVEA